MARAHFIPSENQGNFREGAQDLTGALGFAINRKDTERHRDEDQLIKMADLSIQRNGNWKMAAIADPGLWKQVADAYNVDLSDVTNPETGEIYKWDEVIETDENGTILGYKVDLGEGAHRYALNKTSGLGYETTSPEGSGGGGGQDTRMVSEGGGETTRKPGTPDAGKKPKPGTGPPAHMATPYDMGPSQRQATDPNEEVPQEESETAPLNAKRLIPLLQAEIASAATQGRDVDATALAEKYISSIEGIGPKGRQAILKAAEQAQDAVLDASTDATSLIQLNQQYMQRANQLTPFGVQNGIPSLDFWMDAHRNDPQGQRYYKFAGQALRDAESEPNWQPPAQPRMPTQHSGPRESARPGGIPDAFPRQEQGPELNRPEFWAPQPLPGTKLNRPGSEEAPIEDEPPVQGTRETETSLEGGGRVSLEEYPFELGEEIRARREIKFVSEMLSIPEGKSPEAASMAAALYNGRPAEISKASEEAKNTIISNEGLFATQNIGQYGSQMEGPRSTELGGNYSRAFNLIERGLEQNSPGQVQAGIRSATRELPKLGAMNRGQARNSPTAVSDGVDAAIASQRQYVAEVAALIESNPGMAAMHYPEATSRYQAGVAQAQKNAQSRIQTRQQEQQMKLFERQVSAQVAAFDKNQQKIINALGDRFVDEALSQGYINDKNDAQAFYYRQMAKLKGVELSYRKAALDAMEEGGPEGAGLLQFMEFLVKAASISDENAREQILRLVGETSEGIDGLPFKWEESGFGGPIRNFFGGFAAGMLGLRPPGGLQYDPGTGTPDGGGAPAPTPEGGSSGDPGLVGGYNDAMDGLMGDYGLGTGGR